MSKALYKRLLSIMLVLSMMASFCPAVFADAEDVSEESGFEEELESGNLCEEPAGDPELVVVPESVGNPEPIDDPEPIIDSESVVDLGDDLDDEITDADMDVLSEEEQNEPLDEEETESVLVLVHVVSGQSLVFTLSDADTVIDPVSGEEIAAYLAALGSAEGAPSVQDPAEDVAVTMAAADEENQDDIVFRADYLLSPGSYTWTAEADGFDVKTSVLEVTDDSSWGATLSVTLETGLPYGFRGMPEGYELSEEELSKKKALLDNGIVAMVEDLEPGINYVDNEVFFLADNEEYAEMVAEAYSAELKCYEYGVAVLRLTTASTLEAVTAAADMELPLPAVEANQICELEPDYGEEPITQSDFDAMSGERVNTRESWYSWYVANRTMADPYLKDPTLYNVYSDGWHIYHEYQWMHDMVNTYEAWGYTKGSGVMVAVIDTGVDPHEDLVFSTVTVEGLTGTDGSSHGTHVAGIIGARVNNQKGGAGIAPEADILSIRTNYEFANIAMAIRAAAENGADIINMSLSGFGYSDTVLFRLREAIEDYGITVVVAMGNEASNTMNYPAAYSIPGLIAVGAVNEAGKRSAFSSYGSWQDVAAPGTGILSTVSGNGYDVFSGTSMACPVVSGVCALYLSANPTATPAQVEKAIKKATTGGVVDAAKLFTGEKNAPIITFTNLSSGTASYGSQVIITGKQDVITDDLVYTIDGKTPAVKNGVVTVGTKYIGALDITEDNGFTVGKKMTIKAVRVSGMGTVSKVASKTFIVGYADPEEISVSNKPEYVVAGKSVTLKASVSPPQAKQAVTWTPVSLPAGVSFDSKTGVLKTSASSSGEVRIISSSGDAETLVIFDVIQVNPVKTITLDPNNIRFWFGDHSSSSFTTSTISAAAQDADGAPISRVKYSYSSSNKKVATVEQDGTVNAVGKGTAIITVKAEDGSNVTAKCTVQVIQRVTSVSISGLDYVAPGKTATYKAAVSPASADNKAVLWSVSENSYGITIDSKGKLRVPSNVPAGTSFDISAKAKDDGGVLGTKSIEIHPLATYVDGIYVNDSEFRKNGYTTNANGTLKQAVLYSVETDFWAGGEKDWNDSQIILAANTNGCGDEYGLVWSSSNTKVAVVDQSGHVTAIAAGNATITCKAADASGKKATAKIRVINPASGISIASSAGSYTNVYYDEEMQLVDDYKILSVGKSAKNSVKLGDAFGKPSITKVTWDYDVRVYDDVGRNNYLEELFKNKKWITVNSSGTVSAKSALKSYLDSFGIYVDVYAKTTDGTDLQSAYITYGIRKALIKVTLSWWWDWAGKTSVSATLSPAPKDGTYYYQDFYIQGWHGKYNWYWDNDYTVKSSNPSVAGAYVYYEYNEEEDADMAVVRVFSEPKKGSAKITVTATDGSGKKATVNVKVK